MGLYFRRSTKIGPFRLNYSKSGIGWSFGGKHARIGISGNGRKYVSAGAGGVYYRQNLSNGKKRGRNSIQHQSPSNVQTTEFNFPTLLFVLGGTAFLTSPLFALILGSWNALFIIAGVGGSVALLGLLFLNSTTGSTETLKQSVSVESDLNTNAKQNVRTSVQEEPISNSQTSHNASYDYPSNEVVSENSNDCVVFEWKQGDDTTFLFCLPEEWREKAWFEGRVYIPKNIWDDAQVEYHNKLENDNKLAETCTNNNLGIECEKNGEIEKAIEYYEKNLQIGYKASHSYDRLLVIYRKHKRIDDEIRVAELATKMFPSETSYMKRLNKLTGKEDKLVLPTQAVISHPRIIYGDQLEDIILSLPEFDFYLKGYENQEYYHNITNEDVLRPLRKIQIHFKDLLDSAQAEEDYNNLSGAAAIYEQIVAERYWMPAPYDRLIKIYSKAKLKEDELRILKIAIEHFSNLKEKRLAYVQSLALKYNAVDFLNERIQNNKKITYYSGIFELYNPFSILPKWNSRLEKMVKTK